MCPFWVLFPLGVTLYGCRAGIWARDVGVASKPLCSPSLGFRGKTEEKLQSNQRVNFLVSSCCGEKNDNLSKIEQPFHKQYELKWDLNNEEFIH